MSSFFRQRAVTKQVTFSDGTKVTAVVPSDNPTAADVWRGASFKWEPATFMVFAASVDSQTTAVDLGAWVGVTTAYLGARARRVLALEPDFAAYALLTATAGANPRLPISTFHTCLGRKQEPSAVGIVTMPGDSGSRTIPLPVGAIAPDTPQVQCRAADRLYLDFGIPDDGSHVFIKIDTEGFEMVIVPAMVPLLRGLRKRPTLFVSMHIPFHRTTDEERQGMVDALGLYRHLFTVAFDVTHVRDSGFEVLRLPSPPLPQELCDFCDYLATDDDAVAARLDVLRQARAWRQDAAKAGGP